MLAPKANVNEKINVPKQGPKIYPQINPKGDPKPWSTEIQIIPNTIKIIEENTKLLFLKLIKISLLDLKKL